MESMESSVVSSPEELRKPESLQPKSPTSDSTEKTTYVRFLVSNAAAGSVIGKGGSTITDFQSQSGARIQLSRNHEFFPGTTDRIIMVSGAIYEILKSVELILSKLLSELHNEDENNAEPRTKVRLVVPNSSCGGIIGKGGATVRSFIEESRASIKISPQENNYYGQNDRLVTLTGTLDEQMRAIALIVSKLAEDPHYSQSMNTPFSYQGVLLGPKLFTGYLGVNYERQWEEGGGRSKHGGFQGVPYTYVLPPVATAPYNGRSYRPNGNGGKFQNTKEEQSNSLTIGVADEHIGFVVGRGGRNIMEISQISGARIKISDRGDFISGTTDRKVTITGPQRAIRTAEGMIMQKVAYASERSME